MTIPIGRYAALGPPIPPDGMPDRAPMPLIRIEELPENGAGEIVFLIDALAMGRSRSPIKLILGVSPHTGAVVRAAVARTPGAGFVATRPELLPGNLVDIVRSIALDGQEG